MKKIIRQGVFETNSSSTHSLVINASADYTSITPDQDGLIKIHYGDFGWDNETFSDPESKISYVGIYLRDWTSHLGEDERVEWMDILSDTVTKQTGAIGLTFIERGGKWDNGYIDHQSVEYHDLDYLFRDPELLRDFIFGRNSYLETGNDNG